MTHKHSDAALKGLADTIRDRNRRDGDVDEHHSDVSTDEAMAIMVSMGMPGLITVEQIRYAAKDVSEDDIELTIVTEDAYWVLTQEPARVWSTHVMRLPLVLTKETYEQMAAVMTGFDPWPAGYDYLEMIIAYDGVTWGIGDEGLKSIGKHPTIDLTTRGFVLEMIDVLEVTPADEPE
jgi:hypothetical protein